MPIEVAEALRRDRISQVRTGLAAVPWALGPVTLEIGCGHGHFLTAYATAHPGVLCLGIDRMADRLERARRKSERAQLRNIAWLQADADDLLAGWPADVRISRHVFVLFPDPWPKRRHWKNRLVQPAFLDRLAEVCAAGVQLCFRTDHAPYFHAAVAHVRGHPEWEIRPPAEWPFETATVFQQRASGYQSLVARRRGAAMD